MKSTIWKSTFREIKESIGRFLAILAIVALGVGLFAGLKVTQPAMIETTENYLAKTNFFDYRLLTTVGFTQADVEKIQNRKNVKAAEGAQQFEILCEAKNGSNYVLRAHSITTEVNELVLLEGTMPQKADECVVDSTAYDASSIGKTIKLAEGNDEEDLNHFSYQEYKIVGIVQSPLYIQFERGNTSLGNGVVKGFVYMVPEGFAQDYYTEIYVALNQSFPMYSDEYDAYIDAETTELEQIVQKMAEERFVVVKEDGESQLAEGKKELEEKRSEAETELADAKLQLDDAHAQIVDGEKQLAKAKEELESAPETIAKKEAELEAAEQTVLEQEAQLNAAEIAIGVGLAQGLGEVSSAMGSINLENSSIQNNSGDALAQAQSQLAEAKQQIAEGRTQLAEAKQQIASGRAQLTAAKKQLTDGKAQLAEKELELRDAKEKYETGRAEYEDGLAEYNTQIEEAEQKIADGEKTLADLQSPQGFVFGRTTNVGYVCFESDSGIVDGIANIFPVFFFLVAALVCMTTMNRMVEEQRTQIGVLKALGYSEWTIMSKYIFYAGAAALLGCLVGFFLGTVFFPKVIWVAYGMMYEVDTLVYVFDWKLAVISLAAALFCSVGTTWASCRYELSEAAADLMRPKAPKAGKRVVLEYIPFIWKRLKFLQKVSVRNIFRYKKRFFMMIIGISGCTALLVTGFGIRDSIMNIATQQYTEILTYDFAVTYANPIGESNRQDMEDLKDEGIAEYAFVIETPMDFISKKETKSVNVVVADEKDDMSKYLNLHTKQGDGIPYPRNGQAVISNKLSEDYNIKVGDTITLQNDEMKKIEATVSGICRNFVSNYVYLSADTYGEGLHTEAEFKTAYVNATPQTDVHLLSTAIMNTKDVAAVGISADIMERFGSMMRSMNLIVVVIILCAAGLAFIVLYNLTNINITERVREIATIKVLGFYEKETASYVFRENNVLALIGALVGLLLGRLFHAFVMSQIKIDMVSFDVKISPQSYLYSVILTLVFAWMINRLMSGKIDAVSMTESLKSVD